MEKEMIITLTEEELIRLQSILMDRDRDGALRFLIEVIKPKLRQGSRQLDLKQGMGIR